jgi:hypothetical protein
VTFPRATNTRSGPKPRSSPCRSTEVNEAGLDRDYCHSRYAKQRRKLHPYYVTHYASPTLYSRPPAEGCVAANATAAATSSTQAWVQRPIGVLAVSINCCEVLIAARSIHTFGSRRTVAGRLELLRTARSAGIFSYQYWSASPSCKRQLYGASPTSGPIRLLGEVRIDQTKYGSSIYNTKVAE